VFGDPDGSLPGARSEAQAVSQILSPNSALRIGDDASYQELLTLASRSSVMHLATHGRLDPQSPENSYIVLGGGRRISTIDILLLPLKNINLVFLSGCETGTGSVGLEYATLARAFALAGVPSTIATLWRVGDDASRELAGNFYKNRSDLCGWAARR
jgi:CHAT domain-containing protein